jgi:hypothetical protein
MLDRTAKLKIKNAAHAGFCGFITERLFRPVCTRSKCVYCGSKYKEKHYESHGERIAVSEEEWQDCVIENPDFTSL